MQTNCSSSTLVDFIFSKGSVHLELSLKWFSSCLEKSDRDHSILGMYLPVPRDWMALPESRPFDGLSNDWKGSCSETSAKVNFIDLETRVQNCVVGANILFPSSRCRSVTLQPVICLHSISLPFVIFNYFFAHSRWGSFIYNPRSGHQTIHWSDFPIVVHQPIECWLLTAFWYFLPFQRSEIMVPDWQYFPPAVVWKVVIISVIE